MKRQLKPFIMITGIILLMYSVFIYMGPQPVYASESEDKTSGFKIIIHAEVVDEDEGEIDIPVVDEVTEDTGNPKGNLPQTGGVSPIVFYAIGSLLISGGLILKRKDFF